MGDEAIGYAHSIKLEALRQLGVLLKETPKQAGGRNRKGGGSRGSKKEPQLSAPQTLADLGLDKKTSSLAQRVANLSEEKFQDVRTKNETTQAFLSELASNIGIPIKVLVQARQGGHAYKSGTQGD